MSSDCNTSEGHLTTPDGLKIYTKTWIPGSSVPLLARLVFIHGFSDHCNCYGVLFPSLARKGIKTYSFDQRGWGRSVHAKNQQGLTGGSKQVMDDITFFVQSVPEDEPESKVPLFLMGHSMGGGEVFYYAATGPAEVKNRIRGYLGEAPLISLHEQSKPWRSTVLLGRLAGRILPHYQMIQRLKADALSRDPEVCREWAQDPLCHDTGTLEGLAGMLDRADELASGMARVRDGEGQGEGGKARIWVGFGTKDMVLSEKACRKWFEDLVTVADKEYKVYDGWFHKLHAEPGQDKFSFAEDVAQWILDRSVPEVRLEESLKPKL